MRLFSYKIFICGSSGSIMRSVVLQEVKFCGAYFVGPETPGDDEGLNVGQLVWLPPIWHHTGRVGCFKHLLPTQVLQNKGDIIN